jgi:predicted PurR-regulated permease PerM
VSKKSELAQLHERRTWNIAVIIAILTGLIFLKPYWSIIALAMLMAFLFHPIYKIFLKFFRGHHTPAVIFATLTHILAIAIPVILIIYYAITQGVNLADRLGVNQLQIGGSGFEATLLSMVDRVNSMVESAIGVSNSISAESVIEFARTTLPDVLNTIVNLIVDVVSGLPNLFLLLVIYIFVFSGITIGQKQFIAKIKALSPFDEKVNETYFKRIGAMAHAMVKGQLLIASLQAVAGALSLLALGLDEYLIFFVILFTLLNMIPLGSGVITITLGLGSLLFGNIPAGLVILGTHFFVTTNIDNILRPLVVPKEASMPASLLILSAFSGVAYFGLLGVIYGPIIMIIITTTIDAYIAQKKINS